MYHINYLSIYNSKIKTLKMICSLIIVLTVLFIFRKWLKGVKCPLVTDMTGKVVIITGANKGIGR